MSSDLSHVGAAVMRVPQLCMYFCNIDLVRCFQELYKLGAD